MKSIQRRLAASLVAAMALFLVGGVAAFLALARARLCAEFDAALARQAKALATLVLRDEEGRVEFEFAEELMPEFEAGAAPEYFQIWLPGGRVLERSPSLGTRALPPGDELHGESAWRDLTLPDGRAGRGVWVRFVPQVEDDEREGPLVPGAGGAEVTLAYARERETLDTTLRTLLGAAALLVLVLPVVAALTVWLLVRRGLSPLGRIAAEASALGPEHLARRFDVASLPEELQPVCSRLNEALARLEEAFARERRFTSGVAHELRTPIAEVRSAAEVALRWRDDPALAQQSLAAAHDAALQMERTVTTLLALTRCQAGGDHIRRERVDLAEAVRDAWQPFAAKAGAKSLRVEWVVSECAVETDGSLLLGILTNLASNAASHTPGGGSVCWSVGSGGRGAEVSVANTAPDLTPEDLPHLIEPFWRKDASRTGSEHTGLGLALATSFAAALGAELHLTLSDENLLRATVTLSRL